MATDAEPVSSITRLLQAVTATIALAATIWGWPALDTIARKSIVIATAFLAVVFVALWPRWVKGKHRLLVGAVAMLLGASAASTVALLEPDVVARLAGTAPRPLVLPTISRSPDCGINLLRQPWTLIGRGGDAQVDNDVTDPGALTGKDQIRIVYDLHGHSFGVGVHHDESAIAFYEVNDPTRYNVDLSTQGQNGANGITEVYVPISRFVGLAENGTDLTGATLASNRPIARLWSRFWSDAPFLVDVTSIQACSSR